MDSHKLTIKENQENSDNSESVSRQEKKMRKIGINQVFKGLNKNKKMKSSKK